MLLVRTPAPFPMESFAGYLLRLTETNGYESVADVLAIAGVPTRRMGWKIDTRSIERILGFRRGSLRNIAYSRPGASAANVNLLGQPVNRALLSVTRPKICPHCVLEKGFIEAFWDLKFVTACPQHRCAAITACDQCGERLSFSRPGLLLCRCRANLGAQRTEPASDEACNLASVLAAKVRSDVMPRELGGMPEAALQSMSLWTLTSVIATLGSHSLGKRAVEASSKAIAEHAAMALSNWPTGFRIFLREVGERLAEAREPVPIGLRKQFAPLYEALFKRGLPAKEVLFLRQAFIEFGFEEWGACGVDGRLLAGLELKGRARYQPLVRAAEHFGVMPVTARKMAEEGLIPAKILQAGHRRRFIVDASQPFPLEAANGRSLGEREASTYLGIPVSVLHSLRETGHYEVRHLAKPRKAFNENDVQAFREKVIGAARSNIVQDRQCPDARTVTTLGHTLTFLKLGGASRKAALIIGLLEADLLPTAVIGDRIADIVLSKDDVMTFAADLKCRNEGFTRSVAEAALALGCDQQVVLWLAHHQFLTMAHSALGRRITERSIEGFRSTFISLAALARKQNTHARKLSRLCNRLGIEVVEASRQRYASKQGFIRLHDAGRIASEWSTLGELPADR